MNVLILGGNSDIGIAIAKLFADTHQSNITLASRNLDQLEIVAADLKVRHNIQCDTLKFDAEDFTTHETFYQQLNQKPDLVVVAFGILGDQAELQQNTESCTTGINH